MARDRKRRSTGTPMTLADKPSAPSPRRNGQNGAAKKTFVGKVIC